MSEKSKNEDNELKNKKANAEEATAETAQEQCDAPEKEEMTDEEKLQNELETTKESLEKKKKEYMFLLAEFDNFRKRTLKEKAELIKNAGENAMKELLPVTGYIRGGCSPLGMKKAFPTWFNETALGYDYIYVSAGMRGLQLKVNPGKLISVVGAQTADIVLS